MQKLRGVHGKGAEQKTLCFSCSPLAMSPSCLAYTVGWLLSAHLHRLRSTHVLGLQGAEPHWQGPFAWDEGDVQIAPGVYQIPRWVMQPKREQVSNLLVVAAPSASHIGMSTLRMEPQVSETLARFLDMFTAEICLVFDL